MEETSQSFLITVTWFSYAVGWVTCSKQPIKNPSKIPSKKILKHDVFPELMIEFSVAGSWNFFSSQVVYQLSKLTLINIYF